MGPHVHDGQIVIGLKKHLHDVDSTMNGEKVN